MLTLAEKMEAEKVTLLDLWPLRHPYEQEIAKQKEGLNELDMKIRGTEHYYFLNRDGTLELTGQDLIEELQDLIHGRK